MAGMKPSHAAALSLVGWYLIVPPPAHDPKRPQALVDGLAPISEWVVQEVFDTARECREARDAGKEEFKEALKRSDFGNKPMAKNRIDEITLVQKFSEECVASDDPRLKEK
jgi:hypothetical protein